MEINPEPICIAGVWYYRKINCYTYEKYISVAEYKKRFVVRNDKTHAMKPVNITDTINNKVLYFDSINDCAKHLGVVKTTIYNGLTGYCKLIKRRYKVSLSKKKIDKWEYSNKNFALNGED